MLFAWVFGLTIFGITFAITEIPQPWLMIVVAGVVILVAAQLMYSTISDLESKFKKEISAIEGGANSIIIAAEKFKVSAEEDAALWKKTLLERSSGFPSLVDLIGEYEKLRDQKDEYYLNRKSHPAHRAADLVAEHSRLRREAERKRRQIQAIIEYYESIAPFLLDFKEQEFGDLDAENTLADYTPEEQQDPVTQYLVKDEYRSLSSTERNQRALDRFWSRPKSNWMIGRLYERYVGYLFEADGYDVEYYGIFKGYEDLGRDLICRKGKQVVIVQCKNWSKFKTVFENHIFQFFGTVFYFRDQNRDRDVSAAFYCTTSVSDFARRFASELGVKLFENHVFDRSYPCIKCNISSGGEKIYHLPFDQQYDNVKIEVHKGEFYCKTVQEAEKAGFRRAFRWAGLKQ